MSLSSKSNTINALGIFGRLESKQEKYFAQLTKKYSKFPENDDAIGVFNHLSLLICHNVPIGKLSRYIDLLKQLKPYLPFKLKVSEIIVRDDKHLALAFDTHQTDKIRTIANRFIPEGVVKTFYTKVVWFVPEANQEKVKKQLKKIKEMIFYDFILCANRQDDASTIYSSNRYK